jgi:hypothetical protein
MLSQEKMRVEIQEQLDRLTGVVASLAASVVDRDDHLDNLLLVADKHSEQIGNLILVAEQHKAEMADLRRSMAETDRLFQAYLKRLPPQ